MLITKPAGAGDSTRLAREQMVLEIELINLDPEARVDNKKIDRQVLDVIRRVKRHEFVEPNLRPMAYMNSPLPIGHGQTISQPYIVALMTDLLRIRQNDSILEIGTGSGYQAAVLAELASEVFSIEIIEPLAIAAQERLKRLDYDNISLKVGDGYYGWPEHGPFDGILVTAAASHIPPLLIAQLKAGGRMIIPVGGKFSVQQLVVVEKDEKGTINVRQVLPVSFVPLTGGGR